MIIRLPSCDVLSSAASDAEESLDGRAVYEGSGKSYKLVNRYGDAGIQRG